MSKHNSTQTKNGEIQDTSNSTTKEKSCASDKQYSDDNTILYHNHVETVYKEFPSPTVIISDGAYGLGLFDGDPNSVSELQDWYEPHVAAWSHNANWNTTLWLWNTEQGWATIHPLLEEYGWEYKSCNIWDKGIQHAAGNSNTETLRHFPKVTEVCVQYVRSYDSLIDADCPSPQQWLRNEWKRAGLSFQEANTACGVEEAATRKYFSDGDQWYFPPPNRFQQLYEYANTHGNPSGEPYLSPNSNSMIQNALEMGDTSKLQRGKFDCPSGVTNVWHEPPVSGSERQTTTDGSAVHPNQKPIQLLEQIIQASSQRGDVIWDPFTGVATGLVAAKMNDRVGVGAECDSDYFDVAIQRLQNTEVKSLDDENTQAALGDFE